MNRQVLHADLDTFFVSVERLHNKKLMGKPVIVGGFGERAVVASCSYEARVFGVHSAMPMKFAKRLCPHGMYVKGDFDSYSKFSNMVTEIVREESPLYEKASIDEFYLDLTGMDKFFGIVKWSDELKSRITKETGLPISFGLATNKMISKVATDDAKPNGQYSVEYGHEQEYLDPKSVSKIPMVGDKTFRLLSGMGIQTVAMLRQIPVELLSNLFGKNGTELWRRANAIDESPIIPYAEVKSMSSERTFEVDTTDAQMMRNLIRMLTDNLAYDLRQNNKLASCVTVKLRYSNFDTATKQVNIPLTSSTSIFVENAMRLFDALYDRRLLVRLVGVKLSKLSQGNYQINAFDDTLEQIHLTQALDRIKTKYGKGKITSASLLNFSE